MLRTNLSTRPFYNERAVPWGLALAAVALVALTIFNVQRVLTLSREQARLSEAIERDESRARALSGQAARVRSSIDRQSLERVISAAREANGVIDERTFSWTELFNRLETTLPPEVRITSVRPSLDRDRRITLNITVLARGVDDVNEFMERLEATGAFANVLSRDEKVTDSGQLVAALECEYVQPASGQVKP